MHHYDLVSLAVVALVAFGMAALVMLIAMFVFRWFARRRRARPCAEVQELVDRQPDPCLYSQAYLAQFFPDQPLTWDNPDIWLEDPSGEPISNGSLKRDHVYVVHARISNASINPAFSTEIRCRVQGFGYNAPSPTPVEYTQSGAEKVQVLHIAGFGSETTTFRWRTPSTDGHFCLTIECKHPTDKNTWNNVGQENTWVAAAEQGGRVEVGAILANPLSGPLAGIEFDAYSYSPPNDEIEFQLKTHRGANGGRAAGEMRTRPERAPSDDAHEHEHAARNDRKEAPHGRRQMVRYRYTGGETLLAKNRAARQPLPEGWRFTCIDANAKNALHFEPGEVRTLRFAFDLPQGSTGGRTSVTVVAKAGHRTLGGFTVHIDMEARHG